MSVEDAQGEAACPGRSAARAQRSDALQTRDRYELRALGGPGSARVLRPALGLLLPVALAVFWEIAVRMGLSNGRLVPPPSVIWNTFTDLAATGELAQHAFATLWRVAWGFVFGVAAGTIFGAIVGYSALTHRLVDPTLQALRS